MLQFTYKMIQEKILIAFSLIAASLQKSVRQKKAKLFLCAPLVHSKYHLKNWSNFVINIKSIGLNSPRLNQIKLTC